MLVWALLIVIIAGILGIFSIAMGAESAPEEAGGAESRKDEEVVSPRVLVAVRHPVITGRAVGRLAWDICRLLGNPAWEGLADLFRNRKRALLVGLLLLLLFAIPILPVEVRGRVNYLWFGIGVTLVGAGIVIRDGRRRMLKKVLGLANLILMFVFLVSMPSQNLILCRVGFVALFAAMIVDLVEWRIDERGRQQSLSDLPGSEKPTSV
jgi:hypothetical protein